MNKWFVWKFLEGNVQLAISGMKISFPKISEPQVGGGGGLPYGTDGDARRKF